MLPKYAISSKEEEEYVEVDDKVFCEYLKNYTMKEFNGKRFVEELQNVKIQTYSFFLEFIKEVENDRLKKELLKEKF